MKKRRNRNEKQIAALVKKGSLSKALRRAKGWSLDGDLARRIVDRWQALFEFENLTKAERENFLKGDVIYNPSTGKHERDPDAVQLLYNEKTYQQLEALTYSAIRVAIRDRDAQFFERMAQRIRESEPERDDVRVSAVSEMIRRKTWKKGLGALKKSGKSLQDYTPEKKLGKDMNHKANQVKRVLREFGRK